MSLEYAINGIVLGKIEVYNFRVLLLEIISGMKNKTCIHSNHTFNLIVEAMTIELKFLWIYHNPPTLDQSYYSGSIMVAHPIRSPIKMKFKMKHWPSLHHYTNWNSQTGEMRYSPWMMTIVIERRPNMFDDGVGRRRRVSDEEGDLSEGST